MSSSQQSYLVVGLGNPGARYEHNRHNVGFHIVDALARALSKGDTPHFRDVPRYAGQLAEVSLGPRQVLLLKPQTYMNLSGESVLPVAEAYGVDIEHIIAIHDDVDLLPGRLKLKGGGGDGGHRGLRSMSQELESGDYLRVRVGVGRPEDPEQEVADFVLSDFDDDERELMDEAIGRAVQATRCLITQGLREAMNRFNSPKRKPKPKPDAQAPENTGQSSREKPAPENAAPVAVKDLESKP